MKNKLIVVVGTLGILFYFFALYSKQHNGGDNASVSSYGKTATGTSRVVTALKNTHPGGVTILGSAILSVDQLSQTSLLIMTSLTRAVSTHEAKEIAAFVKSGGTLLLSYHSVQARAQIRTLLDEFDVAISTKKSSTFRNHHLETIAFPDDVWFFRKGEVYGLYSPLVFDREGCSESGAGQDAACYLDMKEVGLGKVISLLGIPFFANGLVASHDNARLTARLFAAQSQTTFDEFHHYFSEKTVADLLALPAFLLPISGLVICLLLFFVLGPSHQVEPVAIAPLAPLRGFHDVNVALLRSELRHAGGEAITLQARFLARQFPTEAAEIDAAMDRARSENAQARDVFWQFCKMHQKMLLVRGRRQKT